MKGPSCRLGCHGVSSCTRRRVAAILANRSAIFLLIAKDLIASIEKDSQPRGSVYGAWRS
jgi:hypothetical protein